MKKLLPFSLTAILILAFALSGCGGGNGGGGTNYTPGELSTYTIGGVSFNMRYAPSGSFTSDDDIINNNDSMPGPVTVANAYWMAETEVTYELWLAVHTWATDAAREDNQYYFQNDGAMGYGTDVTDQDPVTTVSWRDAMVWCNALTEYYNAQNGTSLACVYSYNNSIVRDSGDSNATDCDGVTAVSTAKGFRLPTSDEWQLAARYENGTNWTPGDHVSGDTSGYCFDSGVSPIASTIFGNYAWYGVNSDDYIHPVGEKLANALNIKDMSGNVWEWCFDWHPSEPGRVVRGGEWCSDTYNLQVGRIDYDHPAQTYCGFGFRFVRTQ